MDYKNKYLKYKNKYLNELKLSGGGIFDDLPPKLIFYILKFGDPSVLTSLLMVNRKLLTKITDYYYNPKELDKIYQKIMRYYSDKFLFFRQIEALFLKLPKDISDLFDFKLGFIYYCIEIHIDNFLKINEPLIGKIDIKQIDNYPELLDSLTSSFIIKNKSIRLFYIISCLFYPKLYQYLSLTQIEFEQDDLRLIDIIIENPKLDRAVKQRLLSTRDNSENSIILKLLNFYKLHNSYYSNEILTSLMANIINHNQDYIEDLKVCLETYKSIKSPEYLNMLMKLLIVITKVPIEGPVNTMEKLRSCIDTYLELFTSKKLSDDQQQFVTGIGVQSVFDLQIINYFLPIIKLYERRDERHDEREIRMLVLFYNIFKILTQETYTSMKLFDEYEPIYKRTIEDYAEKFRLIYKSIIVLLYDDVCYGIFDQIIPYMEYLKSIVRSDGYEFKKDFDSLLLLMEGLHHLFLKGDKEFYLSIECVELNRNNINKIQILLTRYLKLYNYKRNRNRNRLDIAIDGFCKKVIKERMIELLTYESDKIIEKVDEYISSEIEKNSEGPERALMIMKLHINFSN